MAALTASRSRTRHPDAEFDASDAGDVFAANGGNGVDELEMMVGDAATDSVNNNAMSI